MKKMITKIMKTFNENVWLLAATVIILIAVGALGWKWSLHMAGTNRSDDSVNALSEADTTEGYENLTIDICQNQAYLIDSAGKHVFGPCKYIYDDLEYYNYSKVFRYVDDNGLIGYAKVEDNGITILYSGVFSQASKMSEGGACVKEGEEYYYIDTEGKRFTNGKYLEAYPFGESQGSFARVQKSDGSWSVIDRKENEVLTGFDSINELPYFTLTGSGVKDGKAVIFSLEQYQDMQASIIYEFEEYTEISALNADSDFVSVKDKNGKQGLICIWNGEVVMPAEYEDIQLGLESDDSEGEEYRWFRGQKEDGTYDIQYWKY